MKVVLAIADRGPLIQPYIINLYQELKDLFELTVVIPHNFTSRSQILETAVERYEPRSLDFMRGKVLGAKLKLQVFALSRQCNIANVRRTVGCRPIGEVAASLKAIDAETVIAVDYPALLACEIAGIKAHFVSLELMQRSIENLLVRTETLRSCVTQNWLRYLSLFPNDDVPYFIVPNFPPFARCKLPESVTDDFVLAGSATPGFGLYVIADFLKEYPQSGTFLGWSPPEVERMLFERGLPWETIKRITLSHSFIPEAEFVTRIAPHRYAFSIYDLRDAQHKFHSDSLGIHPWSALNYITGFPGKSGMCMNAGVPVIASNYPGMEFVQTYGVGAVVSDYSPIHIQEARQTIIEGGQEMRRRCIDLAERFCFKRCIRPFLEYVGRG